MAITLVDVGSCNMAVTKLCTEKLGCDIWELRPALGQSIDHGVYLGGRADT